MEKTKTLKTVYQDIDWLEQVIQQNVSSYLQDNYEKSWIDIPVPNLEDNDNYSIVVRDLQLNLYERLALVLAITPSVKPQILDVFFGRNQIFDRGFTEFGGVIDKSHSGFLPTIQTLIFLISATNPELRFEAMNVINPDSILMKKEILSLSKLKAYHPRYSSVLKLNDRWLNYFLTGIKPKKEYSSTFPAHKITADLEWNDLVLDDIVIDQLTEVKTWLTHGNILLEDWELKRHLKPGYRTLFYGAPGTGKTLAASLLGKSTGREVYRVDLSRIVSKYIGETEENLGKIFDTAEQKNWILFFDEADALFGKRTRVRDTHDRYANQEVSYVLQRIENFSGIIILASNMKANLDEAFTRRFQSTIHFNMPSVKARYKLWQKAFSNGCKLSPDIDVKALAENYELSGGHINSILRFCALKAVKRDSNEITKKELLAGIKNELKKEGRGML